MPTSGLELRWQSAAADQLVHELARDSQQLACLSRGDHIIEPREYDSVGQEATDQFLDQTPTLCTAQLTEDRPQDSCVM
ncbi:MAG: hypothetical protein ACKOE2_15380 [Actinomycetales bacterium]